MVASWPLEEMVVSYSMWRWSLTLVISIRNTWLRWPLVVVAMDGCYILIADCGGHWWWLLGIIITMVADGWFSDSRQEWSLAVAKSDGFVVVDGGGC